MLNTKGYWKTKPKINANLRTEIKYLSFELLINSETIWIYSQFPLKHKSRAIIKATAGELGVGKKSMLLLGYK